MKKIFLSFLILTLSLPVLMASPSIFTPELTAPNNNQSGVAPNVTLDWNAVVGNIGLHYILHLSTDEAFTSPVEFTTELTRYEMANLMFGGVYYWKVKAIDMTGQSDWSEVRSFTVVSRPMMRRPANNANNQDANVLIQWDAITGVSHFDFQIDTVSTFDSPYAYITPVAGSKKEANAANLLFGEGHYVRLRARHALDTTDWTNPTFFTVTSTFNISRPNDNATDVVPDAEFQWTRVNGINKYNVLISLEPEVQHYDSYNVQSDLTRIKPDTLLFGTQYYWRMLAIHSKDTLYSAIRAFTTVVKPTLKTPANNSTNVQLTPSLTWGKISGVKTYELELASNSAFTGARHYNISATGGAGDELFKVPIHVLDSASTYFWRVKAISSRDSSAWSDTFNFRCVALGVEDPADLLGKANIFPSPAAGEVNIQMKSTVYGNAEVSVYDLLGKTRIERQVQITAGQIRNFDLENLPDGIYMINIKHEGVSATSKLIIRR